jgi:hypothetical protein
MRPIPNYPYGPALCLPSTWSLPLRPGIPHLKKRPSPGTITGMPTALPQDKTPPINPLYHWQNTAAPHNNPRPTTLSLKAKNNIFAVLGNQLPGTLPLKKPPPPATYKPATTPKNSASYARSATSSTGNRRIDAGKRRVKGHVICHD